MRNRSCERREVVVLDAPRHILQRLDAVFTKFHLLQHDAEFNRQRVVLVLRADIIADGRGKVQTGPHGRANQINGERQAVDDRFDAIFRQFRDFHGWRHQPENAAQQSRAHSVADTIRQQHDDDGRNDRPENAQKHFQRIDMLGRKLHARLHKSRAHFRRADRLQFRHFRADGIRQHGCQPVKFSEQRRQIPTVDVVRRGFPRA